MILSSIASQLIIILSVPTLALPLLMIWLCFNQLMSSVCVISSVYGSICLSVGVLHGGNF